MERKVKRGGAGIPADQSSDGRASLSLCATIYSSHSCSPPLSNCALIAVSLTLCDSCSHLSQAVFSYISLSVSPSFSHSLFTTSLKLCSHIYLSLCHHSLQMCSHRSLSFEFHRKGSPQSTRLSLSLYLYLFAPGTNKLYFSLSQNLVRQNFRSIFKSPQVGKFLSFVEKSRMASVTKECCSAGRLKTEESKDTGPVFKAIHGPSQHTRYLLACVGSRFSWPEVCQLLASNQGLYMGQGRFAVIWEDYSVVMLQFQCQKVGVCLGGMCFYLGS